VIIGGRGTALIVRAFGTCPGVADGYSEGIVFKIFTTLLLLFSIKVFVFFSYLLQFGGDSRLIAVFGQDYVGRPQKLSILLQDSESKQTLYGLLNALS